MNIFWLDNDLRKCAQYHCDKHVVKMIVEYTQLLSSSSHQLGVHQGYKLSHQKHPDTLWLMESGSNWHCLKSLTYWLHEEYKHRYGKVHKSYLIARTLVNPHGGTYYNENININIPPQCMPEKYKCADVIMAYRNYYIGEKARFATWKNREIPPWFNYSGELLSEFRTITKEELVRESLKVGQHNYK